MSEHLFRCGDCKASGWFRTLPEARVGICEHSHAIYRTHANRPGAQRRQVIRGGRAVEVNEPPMRETR